VANLYSKFGKILVKVSVFGVLYPYRCTNGMKFGMEKCSFGSLLHAKFHILPLWGEKPQNRPLSNLNTIILALCTAYSAASNKHQSRTQSFINWKIYSGLHLYKQNIQP